MKTFFNYKPLFWMTLLLCSFLCPQLPAQSFQNVAADHGITQTYGQATFGGGLSFCDFNGDGWDDLTFATEHGDSLLFFVNNEGNFTQIPSLVPDTGEAKQVLWVDYDNDGDKDLFVSHLQSPNKLYQNDGFLNFTDVSESAGLTGTPKNTYGATFGDYDNDGWLDLYICHRYSNDLLITNELYHNNGNGQFTEVSQMVNATDSVRPTFCAAFLDFNADGKQDIYISNDRYLARNTLLKNTGQGTFTDISVQSGAGVLLDAMNVSVGDYDNDGDQDIYVTNTPFDGNMLLQNNGNETFTEVAEDCGVVMNLFGWGSNFCDFDNDTDLDLYVCAMNIDASEPSALYINDGSGLFSHSFLQGDTVKSFSNAVGDFNNDGNPDIAVSSVEPFPFMLFENQQTTEGHWLKINLLGTKSNRDGIGSWIEVYFAGQKRIRYTHCGEGYLAQNSSTVHFGVGTATMIDSVKVKWLSGSVDMISEVAVDQVITIVEESTLVDVYESFYEPFHLFPNPATDVLWFGTNSEIPDHFDYEIIDQQGKIAMRGNTDGEKSINIGRLPAGTYFFKMGRGNSRVSKFVKW